MRRDKPLDPGYIVEPPGGSLVDVDEQDKVEFSAASAGRFCDRERNVVGAAGIGARAVLRRWLV
jgi:hypothetical protein